MTQFACAVPFKVGEIWCRHNFFSLDMNPIGDNPSVVAVQAPATLDVALSEATKTTAENHWGAQVPVIEVFIQLSAPAQQAGSVAVTIEVDLEGELIACAAAADACNSGSSG